MVDWHAFSYEIVDAMAQDAAFEEYARVPVAPASVIPESWSLERGAAAGSQLPDLTPLRADVFVFPDSFEWTMAFTHEQPELGPYFTWRDCCRVDRPPQ